MSEFPSVASNRREGNLREVAVRWEVLPMVAMALRAGESSAIYRQKSQRGVCRQHRIFEDLL